MATKEERASKKIVTDILSMLVQTDGVTVNQIAATTGHGRSTVGKALAQMGKDGKAVSEKVEGQQATVWYAAAEEAPPPKKTTRKRATNAAPKDLPRLGRGELVIAVLATLTGRPGEPLGPVEVAKFLGGRSVGAVANDLEKLAADPDVNVWLTQEKPRRYAFKG